MNNIVIDRRKNDKKKSSVNRQRFLRRVKNQVKDAVKRKIKDGKIEDIVDEKGKNITIPGRGLDEPTFSHNSEGGIKDIVHPGNDQWNAGDRIPRPPSGEQGGGGEEGSDSGEGEDEFNFSLTKEEFLDMFFEDLELPDLVKKNIEKTDEWENKRAGFSTDGNPSRLNVLRSMKQAKGRKTALRAMKKKKLKKLEKEKAELEEQIEQLQSQGKIADIEKNRLKEVEDEIEKIKRKLKAIPFVDDVDLRYNRWEKHPVPSTSAVMFCVLDVSASMDEWKKEMAKRFFMLLYLFLTRDYDHVEIVRIRHHTEPKEVDEEEFFYSKETGGTIVSPALDLVNDIIDQRYPLNQWNIFMCQASDGDNFKADNSKVVESMTNKLLPKMQYCAYVEINKQPNRKSDLWPDYENMKSSHSNLEIAKISDVSEVFSVLRGLFKKRE